MPGRKPSAYNLFMSKHLPSEIKRAGSQTVAFKRVVKMWNESKGRRSHSRSHSRSPAKRSPARRRRSPSRR